MLLKKIGLVAVLTTTLITGGAAVANADSGVGIGAPSGGNTSAGLEAAYAGSRGYAAVPTMGSYAYGYARDHSSRTHIRHAGMKHND
jgi:hypothetical protein